MIKYNGLWEKTTEVTTLKYLTCWDIGKEDRRIILMRKLNNCYVFLGISSKKWGAVRHLWNEFRNMNLFLWTFTLKQEKIAPSLTDAQLKWVQNAKDQRDFRKAFSEMCFTLLYLENADDDKVK